MFFFATELGFLLTFCKFGDVWGGLVGLVGWLQGMLGWVGWIDGSSWPSKIDGVNFRVWIRRRLFRGPTDPRIC